MARKVFQTISWRNHAGKSRSFRWDDVRATSSDAEAEMLSIIYETFQQGRIPVLEEMSSREAQFSHLSFQELMAAEYAAAIVQHGHSTANLDAYANHFLSNSSLNRERDRLAENWWMQVWMNTSELLDPAAFAEWCKTLTMDEEAVLKVGKVVQWVIDGDSHALCQEEKTLELAMRSTCPWRMQPDFYSYFLHGIAYFYTVVDIDWQKNTVQFKYTTTFPGDGLWDVCPAAQIQV